jgi:hypothetical protein
MSYSNREKDFIKNPATRFIEWNGDEGFFYFYDKEAKQRYTLDDFRFIILDQLSTIRGFNEPTDSGIYANEVRHLKKDNLHVKTFKGDHIASGLYETIKDTITAKGGKFTRSLYVLLFDEDQTSFELVCIQLYGSAFSAWLDLIKKDIKKPIYEYIFAYAGGSSEHKKGKIVYKKPVIVVDDIIEISEEVDKQATRFDQQFQDYLKSKNGAGASMHEEKDQKQQIIDGLPEEVKDTFVQNFESQKKTGEFSNGPELTEDDIPPEYR